MTVTEVVFLPLQDDKTPDNRTHADLLDILLSQPGAQRVYWGRQVEDQLLLRWFVDWDGIEDHETFMKSDAYKPFLERIGGILGGTPMAYHARFTTKSPIAALSHTKSPTTEIVSMWFPTTYSQEDQERTVEKVNLFLSVVKKEAKTYRTSAGGWVDEEVDIPGMDEKGKLYVLLIGWTSVEAHMEFRDSQTFQDNIGHLLSAKDLKKIDAVHSSLTEVSRGSPA